MNKKKIVVAGTALSLAVSAIGISCLSGCKSSMTALNSEMPNAVNGSLKGEFVLEQVKVNAEGIGVDAIRAAVQKDSVARSVFNGKVESKDALPINISVDCVSKEANGGIASVNNVFAFCTLTFWPWVSANENEYTVTASSVVGSHQVKFKMIDRSWTGLSPFAILPVPGWSDERGDEAELKQFHAAQIAVAAKEACANLPSDYATFKKDQPKYLEMISQSRSEAAFTTFLAAGTAKAKVDALTKMVNGTIIAKHQNDLISAFKSISDGSVREGILTKLNDGSFDELPYDPVLISYWPKLGNSRLLAMVYRDGYAKLSEADRKNLVAKITDDAVLAEMVTAPSRDALREAQNKREKQQYELKDKIAELQREAENHKEYAKNASDNLRFSEAKREKKEAEKCMAQVAALQKKLSGAGVDKDEGLYVKDAKARVTLYQVMKADAIKKLADAIMATHKLSDWNSKDISALESVADMSTAVADKNVAAEIAIALACKVDSYRRECKSSYSYRWGEEDKQQWASLKKKITPALSDDIIVSKIKADPNYWNALADLVANKSKVSALAYGFIAEATKSGKENAIKEAWKLYGDDVSDDALLMKLSVGVLPLRRSAFLKIKDEAMKAKTLDAIKESLDAELKKCAEKQGKQANFIAEIGNGEDLVEWLKKKSDQTDIQNKQAFEKMKGRMIVLKGEVRNIGKTMFREKLYVSLQVHEISRYVHVNVQFNIPDNLTSTVSAWQKGEVYVMRGKLSSTGDVVDDAKADNAEIIKNEDYDAAIGLKDEMDSIKWQLKELEEKKMPPESVTPSKFGGAVKKAAGWIKSGVDDIKSSGDDLKQAAEMLNGLFN